MTNYLNFHILRRIRTDMTSNTGRLCKNLIQCHFNSSRTIHSRTYIPELKYLAKQNWFDKLWWNLGPIKNLHSTDNQLKINTRSISTSIVRWRVAKEKSSKSKKLDLDEARNFINIDKIIAEMDTAIENLKSTFIQQLTLRSSIGAIEQLSVEFEGEQYILQELIEVVRKPKLIVLNASTFPQALQSILKALQDSGMNLNPQQDGTTIYIQIPKVTKEHRENLAKNAKALYIKSRDNIKDIRNREVKKLKNIPSISVDQIERMKIHLDNLCDLYIRKAENILETKQKELLKID